MIKYVVRYHAMIIDAYDALGCGKRIRILKQRNVILPLLFHIVNNPSDLQYQAALSFFLSPTTTL